MSGTLSGVPRDGYKSIPVKASVRTRAKTLTQDLDVTWNDIVMAGAQTLSDHDEDLETVRVDEIDDSVIDEVANRVGRSVREELQGGPY